MLKPHVDILNCCISPDWVFVVLLCPIGTALSDAIEESDSPTSLFIVVTAAVAVLVAVTIAWFMPWLILVALIVRWRCWLRPWCSLLHPRRSLLRQGSTMDNYSVLVWAMLYAIAVIMSLCQQWHEAVQYWMIVHRWDCLHSAASYACFAHKLAGASCSWRHELPYYIKSHMLDMNNSIPMIG